jgi:hypothetical protein
MPAPPSANPRHERFILVSVTLSMSQVFLFFFPSDLIPFVQLFWKRVAMEFHCAIERGKKVAPQPSESQNGRDRKEKSRKGACRIMHKT